jgi:hypothetical protein
VEDDRGVEAAAWRFDQTGAGATGRPGCGGARGGTGCRGGGGVEEPATLGCSWTVAVGGRTSQGGGGWASGDDRFEHVAAELVRGGVDARPGRARRA